MPGKIQVLDLISVELQLFQTPVVRGNPGFEMDTDQPGAYVEPVAAKPGARINLVGNLDVDGLKRRLEIGCEMKSALIEVPCDLPFGSQENRLARPSQATFGVLEYLRSSLGVRLPGRPEDADQPSDEPQGQEFAEEAAEEVARIRKPQCNDDKHVEHRSVIGDEDRLTIDELVRLAFYSNSKKPKSPKRQPTSHDLGIEPTCLKQGEAGG